MLHTRHLSMFLILPALLAAGCVTVAPGPPSGLPSAPNGARAMIRTELYFGALKPDGAEVTDAEWRAFLDTAITSRFPDGLTVMDAHGQYRGASGRIDRERSRLVVLLRDADTPTDAALAAIIDGYKRSFRQESVLRVDAPVWASF